MPLHAFQQLLPVVQLCQVLHQGTYLTWCSSGAQHKLLYHVPTAGRGFFVELGMDEEQTRFFVLRSFSDSEPLTEYAQRVRLPGE